MSGTELYESYCLLVFQHFFRLQEVLNVGVLQALGNRLDVENGLSVSDLLFNLNETFLKVTQSMVWTLK